MWWWRRKEKVGDTDGVRKNEVFHGARKDRKIIQTIKIKKANWIGHFFRRDWLLKHIIVGKIEGRRGVRGIRGRRRKLLLDDTRKRGDTVN
jgi:hypothetical protein